MNKKLVNRYYIYSRGKYLIQQNKWTEDINKAKAFNSGDEAFNYARSMPRLPKSAQILVDLVEVL